MKAFSVSATLLCLSSVFLLMLCSQGCTPRALVVPPVSPYSNQEIQTILNRISEQGRLVTTLFCTGNIVSKTGENELEAMVSFVGSRNPLELRIEVVHPWGPPIAYVQIRNNRFKLLVFREKRMYSGSTEGRNFQRYFPLPLDPAAVWDFFRGYPLISPHKEAISVKKGSISLLDPKGNPERRIYFNPQTYRPEACFYPNMKVTEYYDAFEKEAAIEYARKVVLKDKAEKDSLVLHIRQILFNPRLPTGIFDMKRPKGFESIDLTPSRNGPMWR